MFITEENLIGRKIKYYRKKRKFTQSKLAELVDLSEKHISKIEAGTHQPSVVTFFKIIEVLDIGLDEFGFSQKQTKNDIRDELFRYITASTDYELNIILSVVKALKNNLKTR